MVYGYYDIFFLPVKDAIIIFIDQLPEPGYGCSNYDYM